KSVGTGRKALIYLGRYLYRGVIQEKDIVTCKDGKVTYRYKDSKTKKRVYKTVQGETFLWLLMQHVLPKGFRRARNFGFLHPNSKRLIQLVQYLLNLRPVSILELQIKRPQLRCKCCGAVMQILATQIFPSGEYKVKDGARPLAM
ncbi:MAG: transposase, partial [Candidatus Sedimenticola sp. (ex Thyasira tokunagai)]